MITLKDCLNDFQLATLEKIQTNEDGDVDWDDDEMEDLLEETAEKIQDYYERLKEGKEKNE